MNKKKIRLIDSNDGRRRDIGNAIERFNAFQGDEACFDSIWSGLELRNETAVIPDLFLLHISNQTDGGKPYYGYLQQVNSILPNALIVLYSGGRIKIKKQRADYLTICQDEHVWDFKVKNGDQFCVIGRPVNSAADLNIGPALEKYTDGGTKHEFFNLLLGPEKSEHYLFALAILCQGYLAAHAVFNERDGKWEPKEVLSALHRMGWIAFMASQRTGYSFGLTDLKKEKGRVVKAAWWSEVLDGTDFRQVIEEEWRQKGNNDMAGPIKELLKKIKDGKEIMPPKIVADAYCAIVEHLEPVMHS